MAARIHEGMGACQGTTRTLNTIPLDRPVETPEDWNRYDTENPVSVDALDP